MRDTYVQRLYKWLFHFSVVDIIVVEFMFWIPIKLDSYMVYFLCLSEFEWVGLQGRVVLCLVALCIAALIIFKASEHTMYVVLNCLWK